MNSDPQEIHQIELNGDPQIDRSKYRVLYKPRKEGNREIFDDDRQYIRRTDGSLVRITEKVSPKSKKERAKDKRLAKRKLNEANS